MNNETTAKEYADQVAQQASRKHGNGFELRSLSEADFSFYLETAFIAGVNHAAARFMEDKAAAPDLAEVQGQQSYLTADEVSHNAERAAEQQRLLAVLDQVAVEACAGVNECASLVNPSIGAVLKLHLFKNGQWQILGRECQGEPFVYYTIPPFQQSEAELAAALRAAFSA